MAETTTTGKNITTVEELTTLSGTEKVFVNSGGTIKQIAPENAKFGGGTVTVFYVGEETTNTLVTMSDIYANLYKDPELTEMATAQEVCDACMAGLVWLGAFDSEYSRSVYTLCTYIYWCDSNDTQADSTNVVYTEVKESNNMTDFTYIRNGTKPSTGK